MGTRSYSGPRLKSLLAVRPGWVRMAVCRACGRMSPLPVEMLIRRHGPEFPVEFGLLRLRCRGCGAFRAEAREVPLCEPGCARRRF